MRLVLKTAFVRALIARIKAIVPVADPILGTVVGLVACDVREAMRFILRVEVGVAGVSCVIHHEKSVTGLEKNARKIFQSKLVKIFNANHPRRLLLFSKVKSVEKVIVVNVLSRAVD